MHYSCEKHYKPIVVQYCMASYVSWVRRLTLLDLRTHSWNGIRSYVGDLLYIKWWSTVVSPQFLQVDLWLAELDAETGGMRDDCM